jgi:hypothetical protein
MTRDAGPGVLGVEHRVSDQLAHVVVFQTVEDGAGLATVSARSLTDSSRSTNAHNT